MGAFGVFDALQNVLAGVLRGCGKSALSSCTYFCCFYGLMLPGAAIAAGCCQSAVGVWLVVGGGLVASASIFSILVSRQRFTRVSLEIMCGAGEEKAAALLPHG